MKWFKHDTDASRSEKLQAIESEFGIWGYAAWFKLLERIAEKMDKTDRCHAEYSIHEWCRIVHCKHTNFITFLEETHNVMGLLWERHENIIRIEIPKLLQKKDEYSKRSGQSPESVGTPSLSVSISKNIKEELRAKSSKNKRANRKQRVYRTDIDTWNPNESHIQTAKDRRIDLDLQARKFKNYAKNKKDSYKDLDAAFDNWLLSPFQDRPQTKADRTIIAMQAMVEEGMKK